ncbi:hypothetical protein AB0C13_28970, partial [Streptomyces sp. NPDC049099]
MTDSKAVATATYADTIITAVGNGEAGFVADGGSASGTKLNQPLYIGGTWNHRVRKVFAVAAAVPPPIPVADLYGEIRLPVTVPRREEFDLGARVHNRGPAIAGGEHITVVLTLADGLESTQENNGRRLTR